MKQHKKSENDPYSSAIGSLVKKTIISIGVLFLVVILGAGYMLTKSLGKRNTKSVDKIAANSSNPSSEVLSEQTIYPTYTPMMTMTPSPLSSATASPSASPLQSKSPSPTPSTTVTPSNTSTPSPSPNQNITKLYGANQLDGYISSYAEIVNNAELRVGRDTTKTIRSFMSFDISSVSSKKIKTAKLRIYQAKIIGSPYSTAGEIKIDEVKYGNTFESSDYTVSSETPSFATVSNNQEIQWKEIDITNLLKKNITQQSKTIQFRLHTTIESLGNNPAGDFVLFESSDNYLKTGNKPEISIETE